MSVGQATQVFQSALLLAVLPCCRHPIQQKDDLDVALAPGRYGLGYGQQLFLKVIRVLVEEAAIFEPQIVCQVGDDLLVEQNLFLPAVFQVGVGHDRVDQGFFQVPDE